jgi:hypothetical protein
MRAACVDGHPQSRGYTPYPCVGVHGIGCKWDGLLLTARAGLVVFPYVHQTAGLLKCHR